MSKKKILILKNDRAGDLFTSLKLISSLWHTNSNIKIYLSELNYGFSFLLNKFTIKKINFNLSIFDRFKIFIDVYKNNYDEIYILSPKTFFYFLPLIFRKPKFYSIVYNSTNRNRPILFFKKILNFI